MFWLGVYCGFCVGFVAGMVALALFSCFCLPRVGYASGDFEDLSSQEEVTK